ncbi:MAG: tripartite tricarboxylate transporter substrate-binding protein [Natronomonas sp.]
MSDDGLRTRRSVLGAAAGVTACLAGCAGGDGTGSGTDGASEESFPQQPVEIVVPFSTGGGFDEYARISQSYWEEHIDGEQPVRVENIEGAGGRTGAADVYSDDDPHRMLFWYPSAALPPQIVREQNYDVTEMHPIGAMARDPNAVVVRSDAGVQSLSDLGSAASDLRFGTQGVGSAAHTVSLMLGATTDLVEPDDFEFVHYDGTGEAQNGLNSGEIDAMIVGTASSAANLHDAIDDVELLSVFGTPEQGELYADRTRQFSSETDIDGIGEYAELTQFVRMLISPPGASETAVSTLRNAFDAVVTDDEFLTEAAESDRPVVNPADHETVEEIISGRRDVYGEEPLRSAFEESLA